MGFVSYVCWKDIEGVDSQWVLDNLYDFVLEFVFFGDEMSVIVKWNEILKYCLISYNSFMEICKVFEF